MKHLWLLRHAKAAVKGPDGDHGRPLTGRGRRQSKGVERYVVDALAAGAPAPGAVLCSSAVRARQTADAVMPAFGEGVELVVESSLYGADPDDIVTRLRLVPADVEAVMVVGHNPTLHELALQLVGPHDSDGRARLECGFPTGALALIALEATTWAQVAPGTGRLEDLFVPAR